MACDLKISKHHSGSWAVLDTGLFYPNEIFVEVKHCGIKLGEWTLDEIVEGFKKSLKEEKKYTPGICGSINKRMDDQANKIEALEKKFLGLRIDHDDLHGAVKNDITNLIDQNKELENKITKVDEMRRGDWKYTQEKTSFHHSELVRLNEWVERFEKIYESHVHNLKPGTIFQVESGGPAGQRDK